MKTTDYFQGFLDRLNKAGFSIFLEEKPFEAPPQVSSNKQILLASAMNLAAGLAGLPGFQHGVGYSQQHNKETLIEDLKQLQNHCDLIGIKDNFGTCHLRLAISADDIPDESLVGRLAIIHEQAQNFQKYTMSMNYARVRPWVQKLFGGSEGGNVECNVFLIFSAHKRAKEFFERHITKCKHGGLFKKIHTYPHIVDLEDEIYLNHSGEKAVIPK